MELGQRIRQVRLEMGLSQRQLCGNVITRNMLSQIENGSARPSMDTLSYLAQRLGKPVSFFLEEDAVTSPNQTRMEQARSAYGAGNYDRVREILESYREPDMTFEWEKDLLLALANLALAEQAIREKRIPYALHLLENAAAAGAATPYYGEELNRRRWHLLAQADPQMAVEEMPELTEMLLLKAQSALKEGNTRKAAALLDAADDHGSERWIFLRGEVCFTLGEYRDAAGYFRQVEESRAAEVIPKLEQCYIALEDYKMAYLYACKQKK